MNKGCKYCKFYPRFCVWGKNLITCKKVKKCPSWYGGEAENWNPLGLDFCKYLNKTRDCAGFEVRRK